MGRLALKLWTVKRAMKTKYKLGALKRLICLNDSDTNFIANFRQVIEILKETDEAVVTPQLLPREVPMMSQNLDCSIGGR